MESTTLPFGTFVDSKITMADVAAEVAKSFFQFGFENKDYELILELFEVFFMWENPKFCVNAV